jgi:RNA polymerase sigma factor (sigma-70 family)
MGDSLYEKEAISMAKGGDHGAQRYLYDQYRTKWFMICLRYLPIRADAEDALQNGLVQIFSKLEKFNPELGEFGGWTSRIMTNECIQILRKNKNNLTTQELSNDLPVYYPEENGLEKLAREDILRIIQKLPAGYRTIFNMYVFDGFSHKEIAEHLKISEGTSKSQLFKARKMLQEALEVII